MKNTARSVLYRLFAVAILALNSVSWAATNEGYQGEKWAFLDAQKMRQASADITLAKYPECDEATVDKRMVRVFRSDGTGECQDESFIKVLTEKGKRNNRALSLNFQLPYSTVEVVKLEVLNSRGEATAVDVAANSKEMIDDSQMGMNIYDPNSKILRVNIPKLEIGDVVHSIVRTTIHRSYIPGEGAEENVFEGPGYIRHMSYEVYTPADRPLRSIVLRDEIPGTVRSSTQPGENQGKLYRWEVNNVPRMFDEPAMPPYDMVLQRLFVSTTPDWAAVSKWYWGVCQPHLAADTPAMKQTVSELTAGISNEVQRIEAIFYFVSKKIRYMGLTPEKDRPGFEPHDVCLTFNNKYGVCRDKAALLVAMLRTAGFEAYPVLVSVGSKKDPQVPDPFFNHAIVGVERSKDEFMLMDPTAENTKDLLPSYECDQSFLVCRAQGDRLRTTPIIPAEKNLMRVKTTASLTAAGALEARSELAFDGINDTEYREAFSHMKPDDRRRFFEQNLKRALPGAKLKALRLFPEDVLDVSSGLRAEIEFSVDGLTACGGNKAVVNLPWTGKGLGIVNFILDGTGLEKRKYPMRTFIACGLQEELQLKLGEGFAGSVSMPAYAPIDDECVSYARRVESQPGRLSCTREFKLKTVEFNPAQYLRLKQTLQTMEYDSRKAPILALAAQAGAVAADQASSRPKDRVESNAQILESHKEITVANAHSETLKMRYVKRILTYSGKKREAELKIAFNPACQEAKLLNAVVISKTGQRQAISTNEVNIMDAGWNASAKRYTGGKILVANLPGVDIGSTIEVELQIATKGKPYIAGFESFQLFDDLDKKDVSLSAAAGVQIQTLRTGTDGIIRQEARTPGGAKEFHWHAENVKALPAESQLPPEWIYMAGAGYYAGSFSDYLHELQQALLNRSGQNTHATEKARALAQGAKNAREKVIAIRDFVAKSIRLAGPSFAELPLSELSAADTTLADGYGHLADRAILLHAMLGAVGLKPEYVLTSGLPPIPAITNILSSLPLPGAFQTPLVSVVIEGQTYYLNDTDQYAQLGATSADGKLAIRLEDQTRFVAKAADDARDRTDTSYSLTVSDSGQTQIKIQHRFFGSHFGGKHRFFAELPPEERRRYYQEIVSGVAQGARPVGDLVTRFDTYPGLEEFTVDIEHYAVVDGRYVYFDLPFTPAMLPSGADDRVLPLFIGQQSQRSIQTEIQLPPSFSKLDIAPANHELQVPNGGGTARVVSSSSTGRYRLTHQFETAPVILSPLDYPALLKVESTLEQKSARAFLLERN